ncbi:UDP-glucose 6-dehydrogenase AglM [Halorussus halophilus]|uniref:UDP-glucose 6-dehydrogenase AglM n=1 Tax=Halorussus halophilus TaxID=2650975 RepID=UPI001301099D|nr:UDP-glucose 6-dehydrogenase AglM [Halorussus halophilus]
MNISIIGSGYVGTTVAACLADLGHDVTNVDIDADIVETINAGDSPIDEPQLDGLIDEHSGERLRATTDYDAILDTELTFLTLTTPSNPDGSLDTSIIDAATEQLGETLAAKDGHHSVVVKSTVVPGTTREQLIPILERTSGGVVGDELHVATNPEFLREGSAVSDFLDPDRVVVGTSDDRIRDQLREVYSPLDGVPGEKLFETDVSTAAMIKYTNNSFLASKVSLINDIGNVCKEFGIDTYEVADALKLDDRISERFLRSGLGWGGSCFPKDVAAITHAATERGYQPAMLEAAVEVNDRQPRRLLSLMDRHVRVEGKPVAVLGLSFKPDTDDTRGSRAIPVIDGLQERGANVVAYDPAATENMREHFPDIEYADSAQSAVEGAVAALVVTDWAEIERLDDELDRMATPVVIDGRNAIDRRDGIVYEGLTW